MTGLGQALELPGRLFPGLAVSRPDSSANAEGYGVGSPRDPCSRLEETALSHGSDAIDRIEQFSKSKDMIGPGAMYRIAVRNAKKAERIVERDVYREFSEANLDSAGRLQLLVTRGNEMHEHVTISIVFSAFTAEAFINFYGKERLGHLFDRFFDGMEVRKKWQLFPELASGQKLDRGQPPWQEPFRKLNKLIGRRNRLAHMKPEETPSWRETGNESPEKMQAQVAAESVETVRELVMTLKNELHPEMETVWLDFWTRD